MFRKVLSSIGIGSARVDLVLNKSRYAAGESISGELRVVGGILDQKVSQVYLKLMLASRFKKGDRVQQVSREFDHQVISTGFEIAAGGRVQPVSLSYTLPEAIPVSTFSTKYFLVTGLDIAAAVDPKDNDQIEVLPGRRQAIVMQAVEKELGFRRRPRTGEYNGRFQEFEYLPVNFMRGKLDELEVIYLPQQDGIKLYLQLDKKARGLIGLLTDEWDLDERHLSVIIPNSHITTPAEVASWLADLIEREYRKII
ncbi:MAG TPA: sporulation protein [Firmicutes bacterium]|nr:sporulation protein [Bacillota bacterium]